MKYNSVPKPRKYRLVAQEGPDGGPEAAERRSVARATRTSKSMGAMKSLKSETGQKTRAFGLRVGNAPSTGSCQDDVPMMDSHHKELQNIIGKIHRWSDT